MNHTVTIFGSSRPGENTPEYSGALALGRELALCGFTVCNGGFGGTMEASARGAKEAGSATIGVITGVFGKRNANRWIDKVIIKDSLLERMMELIRLGDAYVILKGGTGTLLEFAAVWEFMNKGLMEQKPIITLGGFWNGVVGTLKEELAWEGLQNCTRYVRSTETPAECAKLLRQLLKG